MTIVNKGEQPAYSLFVCDVVVMMAMMMTTTTTMMMTGSSSMTMSNKVRPELRHNRGQIVLNKNYPRYLRLNSGNDISEFRGHARQIWREREAEGKKESPII